MVCVFYDRMDNELEKILGEPYYTNSTLPPPTQGTIGGRYDIISDLLDRSTKYSFIYLCADNNDQQKKIIKFIKFFENEKSKILNEITTMSITNHPNVIKLENYFRYKEYMCLILPYTPHRSLLWFQMQYYRRGIPEDVAATMMYQMLKAVQYLHGLKIIHRDIKPDNFLVFDTHTNNLNIQQNTQKLKLPKFFTSFPRIVISDFGFSKFLSDDEKEDQEFVFTPEYMAPEILSKSPYDKTVDIWDLGISLFVMLTGYFPLPSPEKAQLDFKWKLSRGFLSLHILSQLGISSDAQNLIRRMCALDPSQRLTIKEALNHPWILSRCKTNIERELVDQIGPENDYEFNPGT